MSFKKAVTFPRELREKAKQEKLALVCISVPGMEYVGALPDELVSKLVDWTTENIFKRERKCRTKKS
jgi:hypothetical protein